MAKDKIAYVCTNCGQESVKWMGRCPSCGQWNTFREIRISSNTGQKAAASAGMASRSRISENTGFSSGTGKGHLQKLRSITAKDEPRIDMHDKELNRVLGGGLVKGSIVLLGGEPGIGKSTLTLQTILNIKDIDILYVSGEETSDKNACRTSLFSKCCQ